MKYYRLLFKKDENGIGFSDIAEQNIDDLTFQNMNWDKPLIRHFDGEYLHFVSLNREYLECMIVGISAYKDMESYNSTTE